MIPHNVVIVGSVGAAALAGYFLYSHFSSGSTDSSTPTVSDAYTLPQYGVGGDGAAYAGGSGGGSNSDISTQPVQTQIVPSGSSDSGGDSSQLFSMLASLLQPQETMKANDIVSIINAQGQSNLLSQIAGNLPWGGSASITTSGFKIDNSPGIYVNDQNNSTYLLGGLINALGGTGGTGKFSTDGSGGGSISIVKTGTSTQPTGPKTPSTPMNQSQLIAQSFYNSIGNLHPDQEGLAYWTGQLGSGKTIDQVQTAFINSANTVKAQASTGVYNGPVSTPSQSAALASATTFTPGPLGTNSGYGFGGTTGATSFVDSAGHVAHY